MILKILKCLVSAHVMAIRKCVAAEQTNQYKVKNQGWILKMLREKFVN